jgi:hypothetical protein
VNSLATRHAPDVGLPLAHFLTGAAAAVLGGLALLAWAPRLLAQPVGAFPTLAVTHLFTLGWLAMTIAGATYQMVPVVLEVRLRSERLARAGYPVLVAGTALMVAGFWTVRLPLLIAGGACAVAALLAYAGHILATALGAHRRAGVAQRFFLAATGYLVLVCVLGGLLAAALRWNLVHVDLLPVHAVTALLGWATILAMGAAYRLTPMFALSHGHGDGAGAVVLPLVAGGTLAVLAGLLLRWPAPVMAAVGLVPGAAVALFVRDQWAFLRTRRRPRLDPGLRLTAIAVGYLAVTAVVAWLGLAGLWRPGHGAVVILALLGWLGCLVGGQTYKIVPFLVWYRRYAPRAGRERVPLLREMYDERLAGVGMWGLAAAGLVLAAGAGAGLPWLQRLGALCWLFGYGVLAWNLGQVLRA